MRLVPIFALTLVACAAPPRAPVVARTAFDMPFCTRTLGQAQCFATPSALPDRPDSLGDIPVRLAPAPKPWWQVIE